MLISKPSYFDQFHCIAGRCPDSCCKEWAVQVDEDMARFYLTLPGALGDRLRQVLKEEDGEMVMTITDGRCPMWREDGLCRIQAELGESALCKTCRDFPRLTHDYGDFIERGLELSCPEAARIILSAPAAPPITEEIPGGEPEYDEEAMAVLKQTRKIALSLTEYPGCTIPELLALLLIYGYQAQGELDGDASRPFEAQLALDSARDFAKTGTLRDMLQFYSDLEILTPQWKTRLKSPDTPHFPEATRNLIRYFLERYWLQAVSDYDLACRVKFIVISCLMICSLGENFTETAQLYSKEIENNWENVESLLDAAYSHAAFTDDKLLGLLLFPQKS